MVALERLVHFRCVACDQWWSVSDAPIHEKAEWFCPWCGRVNHVELLRPDAEPRKMPPLPRPGRKIDYRP
jgi:hypothetical protein